ncbi:MAG: hypothetical protein ABII64_03380 [Elusimicrobiota bacterium]
MATKKSSKMQVNEALTALTVERTKKEDKMPAKKTKKSAPVDIQKLVSEAAFPGSEQSSSVKLKPAKKAAAKKPAKEKTAAAEAPKLFVAIDYPTEGEVVSGLAYVMRIGASEGGSVEVSVNGADWTSCRNAAGYWWFDWGYFIPGPHTIKARLVDSTRKVIKISAARKCMVV